MTTLGTIVPGASLVATGNFFSNGFDDLLWNSGTVLSLWETSSSGVSATLSVSIPSTYTIDGVDKTIEDQSLLILSDSSGTLYLGTLSPSGTTAAISINQFGSLNAGYTVQATGNFLGFYGQLFNKTDDSIIVGNSSGGENEQPDTIIPGYTFDYPEYLGLPSGFTVVPNGGGNFLGSDVSSLLVQNASGTVDILLNADVQTITATFAVTDSLGTLGVGQSIVAISPTNSDGSTDILLQQSGTITEWVVSEGAIKQINTLSISGSIIGTGDVNGDGASDIITLNSGTIVQEILGTSDFTGNFSPLTTSAPATILDGSYAGYAGPPTGSGTVYAGSLSEYVAQLGAGIPVSANGTRILVMGQSALSTCSFQQVMFGNVSLPAWEQDVATLNAIAQYCRANDITVMVEVPQLNTSGTTWSTAATIQWLEPALAAGLPIGYIEQNTEIGSATTLTINGSPYTLAPPGIGALFNISSDQFTIDQTQISTALTALASSELSQIAIIHEAYPNAVFGEWDDLGSPDSGTIETGYHEVMQQWWNTLSAMASAESLPSISFTITDQSYTANYAGSGLASNIGQGTALGDSWAQEDASFARDAAAAHVSTIIQDADTAGYSPLGGLAEQELEISQEATQGIAGVQVSSGFSWLPPSEGVNVPGSTTNGAAEIQATTTLYQHSDITTGGSIGLRTPNGVIVTDGTAHAVSGLTITATAGDTSKDLAVILIDQTGTLSATQHGAATVSSNGPNVLVLNGTPSDVQSELASVMLDETVPGPDSIDVEVFGNSGRVAGGTIAVVSTLTSGGTVYTPGTTGALPEIWTSATVTTSGTVISTERFTWNTSDSLTSSAFTNGGTVISPLNELLVSQPLLEQGITASGSLIASLPSSDLSAPDYNPLYSGGSGAPEQIPVIVSASSDTYDSTGNLDTEVETISSVSSLYSSIFPFSTGTFYFASGGSAVTQYNTGDNPSWPSSGSLYDNGGGLAVIPDGSTLEVGDGSTAPMIVGAIQTIYGTVSGSPVVIEVKYLGGSSNPYDEIDEIFNPYSATPQLWQQINTVDVPASMASSTPLPVPTLETVTEFDTGNNPDWNTGTVATEISVTYAGEGYMASKTTIATSGSMSIWHDVTWLGEAGILANYTLATPAILSWTAKPGAGSDTMEGIGIAGDWVSIFSSGTFLGSSQVSGDGIWQIGTLAHTSSAYAVQQTDLAADQSFSSTAATSSSWNVGTPTNFDGLGGTDSFILNSSTYLSYSEFNAFGTILASQSFKWASDGQSSPESNAVILDPTSQINATGTNLLGYSGRDFIDTIGGSGTIGTYEVNAAGTIIGVSGTLEVFGSGDSITAASNSDLLYDSGTGDTVSMNHGTIALNSAQTAIVVGSTDVVGGVYGTVTLSGAAEKVTGDEMIVNAGSAAIVTVTGFNNSVSAATGAILGFHDGSNAVSGSGLTINEATSLSNVTVSGNSDTINVVAGSEVSLSGTSESVAGSLAVINETASTAIVSVYGSYEAVTAVSGSVLGITGTSETVTASGITIYGGASTTINLIGSSGTDVVGLYTSSELTWGASNGMGFITGATTAAANTVYASVGTQTVYGFNMALGDQVDLSQFLAGTGVNSTNVGTYVTATPSASYTTLAISGPYGSDNVILSGVSLTLSALKTGNAFVY